MKKLDFISGIKKLSGFYLKEFSNEQISLWYEMFEDIPTDVFNQAIKEIVKEKKYMPNASELYEKCSSLNKSNLIDILKFMYDDGYFHCGVETLTDEHALRNLDKSVMWVERGIIPEFLKKDMMKYMKIYKQAQIKDKERLKIEC